MRRFSIFLTTLFFVFGATLYANEAVLIDFSRLAADFPPDNPRENARTMVDFSARAGTSFSDTDRAAMRTSLAIDNWEVRLAPSARRINNQRLTMAREVPVLPTARRFAGDRIMGVRVNFPNEPFNSWASIRPPFEIPAFQRMSSVDESGNVIEDMSDRHGNKFTDGFGVVKNVGVLRTVSMNMYGSNFPHGIEVVLKDQNNREHVIFMDYMNFEGWRTITWRNPNYIAEVRNRTLHAIPLYPNATPYVKLAGINIRKDAMQEGGDIITYIRDITITFDRAINEFERDIDEEAIWGIMTEREDARRTAEFERLGHIQVLRYLETQRMFRETEAAGN
ncbi:MAG: flagellar filament outer layer protein FlaA [Spirochaetaceae bacterium]|nr:flagellar filament outer layer protein FlaA [Spirochaetaceae bacterium]